MDTGEGRFEKGKTREDLERKVAEYSNPGGIFQVGEIIMLRGSKFRIKVIKRNELRLKLLKK